MNFRIKKLSAGNWQGILLSESETVYGISKEEVLKKLKDLMKERNPSEIYDICVACDPILMPRCNKCLGS